MKIPPVLTCLILCAAPLAFTGCVDPYYSGGGAVAVQPAYRPGYTITTLPSGYRSEVIAGSRYYRHNDIYYRSQGRGYVVVESPHRRFSDRGPGSDRDRGPDRDRDRDGRPNWNDPRPNVPGGPVVRRLPNGYKTVTHRGARYYRAGDVYYQSRGDGYIIVRSPY